jgi:hypothetical protein
VPPPVTSFNVADAPTQITDVPVIAAGVVLTVNGVVVKQPVGNVYVIVSVPAELPVTTPEPLTVANAGLLLLHEPPVVASVNVVVKPAHTLVTPVIAAGAAFTVIG